MNKPHPVKLFKVYSIFFLFIAVAGMSSCKNNQEEKQPSADDIEHSFQQDMADGLKLLENSCFSCHSPNASMEHIIAPTMSAIKTAYLDEHTTPDQFISDFIAFLNNPGQENSKMPEAIRRFNVMPKMNLSEEQIAKIATYVYHTGLETPNWFETQYQEEKLKYKSTSLLSPMEAGQEIAMKTKGVLGKQLLEALNSKGTENALAFCSTRALPLTDSMAVALNARIKRVSDKNRNPQNKANDTELAYITATKLAIAQGEKPKPQLITADDKYVGYYPIVTNNMCLQCHGQPGTDITGNTLSMIEKLYPKDLATGYKTDELRGIWVVEMDKK